MKKSLIEQLHEVRAERKKLFKQIERDSKIELFIVVILAITAILGFFLI